MGRLTKAQLFWAILVVLGLLLTSFIVVPNYFPHLGITLFFLILITASFGIKKHRTIKIWTYAVLAAVLALFITIRANPTLLFIDLLATLMLGVLIVADTSPLSILAVIYSPFEAVYKIFTSPPITPRWSWLPHKKTQSTNKLNDWILGFSISLLVLILILPPLASANPLFSHWLQQLLPKITENLILYIVRIGFFAFFLWLIPKFLTAARTTINKAKVNNDAKTSLLIPKLVTAIVLLIFIISQVSLYTMSPETLAQAGITQSQRTREVFAQLIWVSGVVLAMIWYELKPKRGNWLNLILGLETVALTFFALSSDLMYIKSWGFTFNRLYGLTLLSWLWGFMLILTLGQGVSYIRRRIIELTIMLSAFVLVVVNLVNFDYVIAHYSTLKTHQGIDFEYLSRLSPDSLSYKTQLENIYPFITAYTSGNPDNPTYYPLNNLIYKVEYLQDKYNQSDFRRFNLAEYRQYLEIKNVPIDAYQEKLK